MRALPETVGSNWRPCYRGCQRAGPEPWGDPAPMGTQVHGPDSRQSGGATHPGEGQHRRAQSLRAQYDDKGTAGRDLIPVPYAVKAQTSLAPVVMVLWFTRYYWRMRTNVVYFRVMRRLCRREWNWLWNWLCVNLHPWQRTRDHGMWPVAAPGFKKWGGKKGATIDYGGGQTCARSAHSEREARADFFWIAGVRFFWANMCAERT